MKTHYKINSKSYHKDSLNGGLSLYQISTMILLAVATGILLGLTMKSVLAAVLWFLFMGSMIGLEALPGEERVEAKLDRAETPVAQKVLTLVNALYCVAAVSLAGLICTVIYQVFY